MAEFHVLAVPAPAQSHISAMMHLCKRLAMEPGILISFVNLDSIHEQMQRHWVAPPGLDIRLQSLPFHWKLPNGFDAYCTVHKGAFTQAEEQCYTHGLRKLVQRLEQEIGPVRCIISDYFLPWTQELATELGIPRVALWSGGAGWLSIELHMEELKAKGYLFHQATNAVEGEDCWVDCIGGLGPILKNDLPTYLKMKDDPAWIEQCLKRVQPQYQPSWVLLNTFYELEKGPLDFLNERFQGRYLPVGPLYLLSAEPENVQLRDELEELSCIRWLDKQPQASVLYISFGSIAVLSREQFEELAQALESCKRPFLWVMRQDLFAGGLPADLYELFVQRTSNHGCIVSWAPQLRVLAHPAVGAFLTHCGWNSVLESICNGVPMLGWPWASEQSTNCKFLAEDWAVGARLARHKNELVPRQHISRWMNDILAGEQGRQMRSNLGRLKQVCLKESVQRAHSNLSRLLEALRVT